MIFIWYIFIVLDDLYDSFFHLLVKFIDVIFIVILVNEFTACISGMIFMYNLLV